MRERVVAIGVCWCAFKVALGMCEICVYEVLAPMCDGEEGVVVGDGAFEHVEMVDGWVKGGV